MVWTYSPYTVPLVAVAVLCAALSVFGWLRRPAPGAIPFAVFMSGGALLALGAALLWASVSPLQKAWFEALASLGVVVLPTAWAVLVAECTGREAWVTRRNIALLCVEPILIFAAALTNDWHHLFSLGPSWESFGGSSDMMRTVGPVFVAHVGYSYVLNAGACVLLVVTLRRADTASRRQLSVVLLAGLAPWLADALSVTGLNPFGHLPLMPFGFAATGVLTAWALARLQFLDIVPLAREAIIEGMGDGMIAVDARNRMVYVNRAARRLIAQHYEFDPIGRPVTDLAFERPDLVERFSDANDTHAEVTIGLDEPDPAARRELELTISALRDLSGRQTGRLIALHDITERKATEEALRRSEERYRRIVEAAQEGIWMVDVEGRTVFVNQRMADMLGYTREELQGHLFFDLVPEVSRGFARDIFLARQWPSGSTALDFHFVRRDGSDLWTIINTSPINDASDNLVGGLAMLTDITERKRMENELRQHRNHLEELVAQRTAELETTNRRLQQEIAERRGAEASIRASLEDKEALLKEVHHRVKNNLQVISSLLYLQSRKIDDPTIRQMFGESQNRIRSMALVHERLYDSQDLARIDFGEYVRSLTAHLLRSYAPGTSQNGQPDGVTVTVDVADSLLRIDRAIACGLIINELVSNALKYAFPGPDSLAPKGKAGGAEITVSLRPDGANRLTLTVSDNGVGFPDTLDFRATPSLGLQLVNTLVRQLGGELALDCSAGTEFRITLEQMTHVAIDCAGEREGADVRVRRKGSNAASDG
jgi:PAS domain S-box-containing protein